MHQVINGVAAQWLATKRATRDAATLSKILQRAESLWQEFGGYFCTSHLERAYLELLNEGEIEPFRESMETIVARESQPIPPEVVAYIERASAFELSRRYRTDREFAKQYDLYEKSKGSPQAQATGTLSVEDYRRLPAATIAKRYRSDAQFKAGVDDLIRRGLI